MHKIIDNVLPKEDFENIKNSILNPNFPWNLDKHVTCEEEELPIHASYYFTHMFWDRFIVNPEVQMFAPLLNIMDCHAPMRIKANCYPSTPEMVVHYAHIDYEYPNKGAIFYLNTNNGFTFLENNVKIESVENRLLLFDPQTPHCSTTCTDTQCRINVNFNFF